jgi:hypothetical protein
MTWLVQRRAWFLLVLSIVIALMAARAGGPVPTCGFWDGPL